MTASEATTDEDLVKAALSGDDDAFAELVRRHKRRVFGIAARYAGSRHELEDVSQEVFIKVYKNLGRYRGDAPFVHWISKIAVNACYDLLRKRRREVEEAPIEEIESLPDAAISEDKASEEAWALLRDAMSRLRPDERLVITLLELEERPVREIALLTGWSESKVKVRAFRARKELKRILEGKSGKRSEG